MLYTALVHEVCTETFSKLWNVEVIAAAIVVN